MLPLETRLATGRKAQILQHPAIMEVYHCLESLTHELVSLHVGEWHMVVNFARKPRRHIYIEALCVTQVNCRTAGGMLQYRLL